MALEKFFNPKSVAVIGATEDPKKITSMIIKNLIEIGFAGRLVPVNPKRKEVFGFKCYSSLLDIKEQIENSSLYYEQSNKTWFLFTNHIGIEKHEYTDAIWVYWSKQLSRQD